MRRLSNVHHWLLAAGIGLAATGLLAGPVCAQAAAEQKAATTKKVRKPTAARGKAKDGAEARLDPEQALDQAHKALAAGKADAAAGLADRVLTDDKRDPRNTARALAVRGEARLKLGRLAEAIADLDNALWVKGGVQGAERERATAARADAYRQAGLGKSAQIAAVAAKTPADASPPTPQAPPQKRAAATNWKAEAFATTSPPPSPVTAAPREPAPAAKGGGIGSFFSNLFGQGPLSTGSTKSAEAGVPSPSAAASERIAVTSSYAPQRGPAGSDAAPVAETGRARPPGKPHEARTAAVAASPAAPTTPAAVSSAATGFQLQLAAVRTRPEAEALGATVRKLHPDAMRGRHFDVTEAVYGNMGRFYRLRIGGFATKVESLALCASLRNQGHDCMVLDR
jgi:hypothetical protein